MALTLNIGIIAAFVACLMWGLGDFSIQRSVRKIGGVGTLFWISLAGTIFLLPFILKNLTDIFTDFYSLKLLLITSVISIISGLLFFKALAVGKISVIEPIMSLELIFTVLIGIFLLREIVAWLQLLLIILVFSGIFLVVKKSPPRWFWQKWFFQKKLESGVIIALVSVTMVSLMNIFIGVTSQKINPVIVIWFIHCFITLALMIWLLWQKNNTKIFIDLKNNWKLLLMTSFFDVSAWLAYAIAVTKLPISITIAITESYMALAVGLGIFINKEKLYKHQYLGIALTLIAVIILAAISS